MAKQLILFLVLASTATAANFHIANPNGVIEQYALSVVQKAEESAEANSQRFYGKPFPKLESPIPITLKLGRKNSGLTSFLFHPDGSIYGVDMRVSGTSEGILDECIPHEVMHIVNAVHFRRRLPRWFDEGISSLCEKSEETKAYERLRYLTPDGRRLPFASFMMRMTYHNDQTAAYAQGCSMVSFLAHHDDERRLPMFIEDARKQGWHPALKNHYGYETIEEFESAWMDWLEHGAPHVAARNCPILRWITGRWRRCHMGAPRYPNVQLGGIVRGPDT